MAYVKGGGGLFIAAASDLEVAVLAEMTGWQPRIDGGRAERTADARGDRPAPSDLPAVRRAGREPRSGAVRSRRGACRPTAGRSWRASRTASPALLERALGQGRVVLFASDVDRRWNDFPLHPAFVPFAIEALRYVAGDRREPREYTVAQAPAGTRQVPGVYRSAGQSTVCRQRRRARKRARPDGRRWTSRAWCGDRATARRQAAEKQAQQTESRQSYWQYGLVLMIATLVAESVVGRA